MQAKWCPRCKTTKPVDRFSKRNGHGDGLQGWCKDCMVARRNTWDTSHPDRQREFTRRHTLRQYNLGEHDYVELVDKQGGQCVICGKTCALVVDHCHTSGRVRGLLCSLCNTGLGALGDDPDRLRAAAEYLEADTDLRVVRRLPLD